MTVTTPQESSLVVCELNVTLSIGLRGSVASPVQKRDLYWIFPRDSRECWTTSCKKQNNRRGWKKQNLSRINTRRNFQERYSPHLVIGQMIHFRWSLNRWTHAVIILCNCNLTGNYHHPRVSSSSLTCFDRCPIMLRIISRNGWRREMQR